MTNGERLGLLLATSPTASQLPHGSEPPTVEQLAGASLTDCVTLLGAVRLGSSAFVPILTHILALFILQAHPEMGERKDENGEPTTNMDKLREMLADAEGVDPERHIGLKAGLYRDVVPTLPTPSMLAFVGALEVLEYPMMDDIVTAANDELGLRGFNGREEGAGQLLN